MKAVGVCLWQLILCYLAVSFPVPAGFPPLAAIRMALCWFGCLHGLLTAHFEVTNSVLIAEIPLFFLSAPTVAFPTAVCAQCELIPGFHLQGLHILCSELDWKPLLPGWTEEFKIHASAAGEGTDTLVSLGKEPWGSSSSLGDARLFLPGRCGHRAPVPRGNVPLPAPWSWTATGCSHGELKGRLQGVIWRWGDAWEGCVQLRIQRSIPCGSLPFQLRALVSFPPPAPKDLSPIAAPRRDCSLQHPHGKLECFSAAASGLAAGEDGGMNTSASLNLCFRRRWCRGPSPVPSSALQLHNSVLHHAKDFSMAPCPGIKAGSPPAGVQPSTGCSLSPQIHIHFPLSSTASFANRHWYSWNPQEQLPYYLWKVRAGSVLGLHIPADMQHLFFNCIPREFFF